jgi:plastocyanin
MMERGTKVAGTARWAMFAALAVGAFGCELITSVDRSLIDGGGGSGGTATTSTMSNGGGGGSGGTGGSAPECTKPADCAPPGNECLTNTCDAGKCGTAPVASGTVVAGQTAGDCKSKQCDGKGAVADVNDDTDVPNDNKECTDDKCIAGVASNPNTAAGAACGTNLKCDGNGACVGCTSASDCPAAANECQTPVCTVGVCGFNNAPAGTLLAAQTTGDCKTQQCDGSGAVIAMPDNNDKPVDNKACTDDVCTGGVPSNPNTMAGGVCSEGGGTVCNGSGVCAECLVASTCPGQDNECQSRTCTAGVCGMSFKPAGTATATQTAGDCKKVTCNGVGTNTPIADDTDLPNDNNPCTSDVCTSGVISHPFAPLGTACGASQTCNATGSCGCVTATDCPAAANECQTATCVANTCGFSFAAAGTATTAQTTGDCKKNQCDGAGAIVPVNDDLDIASDGVECTSDTCVAGVPSHPPTNAGATCSQMGGTVCSGSGTCVQCLAASDCPGQDTDCKVRSCTAGACGFTNVQAGTPTTVQTVGDCLENQCDGTGASSGVIKGTDVPVDNNQCTNDICTASVPSNPALPAGTACNQNSGVVCDGAGMCAGPSCTDGVKDGTETGVDCGGSCSTKCANGGGCGVDSDCTSGTCTGNVCSLINGCDLATATDVTASTTTTVTFANGNFSYSPKCLKVKQGTVITFAGSYAGHPLLGGIVAGGAATPAGSGPFVPVTNSGTTKDFTMTATGTFPYYCTAHAVSQAMYGAVFVVP